MSTAQILLLGLLAGLTIFIGLPMGRLHDVGQNFKAFLSATATGILLFLFWDVLTDAIDPVESALHASNWGRFSWLAALAFGGFAAGLLSLVYYDSWMKARRRKSFLGPGAASAGELALPRADGRDRRLPDVLRHTRRPGLDVDRDLGALPHARCRLDPLRRDGAAERLQALLEQDRDSLGAAARADARVRHELRA